MLILTSDDVDRLLAPQMRQLTQKFAEVFAAKDRGDAVTIPRRRSTIKDGQRYQEMAAGSASLGYVGGKMYVGGSAKGAGSHAVIVLFDTATGRARVVIDATTSNVWRTGAATALATDYLAPRSAQHVSLIGTGKLAAGQLAGVCSVREITGITLYSRNADHAHLFLEAHKDEYSAKMSVATDLQRAVAEADIVVTGTTASSPIAMFDYLTPDVHINAVGANQTTKREIESSVVGACQMIVVDDLPQAKQEAMDLIEPVREGIISWDDVVELGEVVNRGKEIEQKGWTLFESQGIALEDVATAQLLFELATEQNVGVDVGP